MWNWSLYGASVRESRIYMVVMFSLWILMMIGMFTTSEAETNVVKATVASHEMRTRQPIGQDQKKCRRGESLRALSASWGHISYLCDYKFTVLIDAEGNVYKLSHHIGELGDEFPVKKGN
jgi:hypothetical protein